MKRKSIVFSTASGKAAFCFFLFIFLLICGSYGFGKKEKEILFPRREFIKKQSQMFFKQVNIKHPSIEKVHFFTRSNAYLSGYLAFSPVIEKNPAIAKILLRFERENILLIENFDEVKKEITIGNVAALLEKFKLSRLQFYLLALRVLVSDYKTNRLSGELAFRFWNIILKFTLDTYKDREKTLESAALLSLSSHLVFFKKYRKWQKRSVKIVKNKGLESISDKNIRLVLETRN